MPGGTVRLEPQDHAYSCEYVQYCSENLRLLHDRQPNKAGRMHCAVRLGRGMLFRATVTAFLQRRDCKVLLNILRPVADDRVQKRN